MDWQSKDWEEQQKLIIGLGETSIQKNYYPELKKKIAEVELLNEKLQKKINELEVEYKNREKAQDALVDLGKKYMAILDNSPSMIYLKNIDGRYEVVNKRFSEFFLLKEVTGFYDKELFENSVYLKFFYQDNEIKTKKEAKNFEWNIDINGEKKYLLTMKFPIFDEKKDLVFIGGITTDITDIKLAENKILELNQELEAKVIDRTKEINETNERLKETIKKLQDANEYVIQTEKMAALGELVAGVAHEINTPIGVAFTGVTHFVDITKEINKLYQNQNLSQDEFEEYLKTSSIIASSLSINLKRAADLVRSFKQVAIDQSNESIREFNVKEYINETLLSLKPHNKKNIVNIIVECDDKLVVKSFPGAYSQIITNLFINSIIHGFEGKDSGEIIINVIHDAKNNRLNFKYVDNGIGMEESLLKKVFDPFVTTKRSNGGSGLGMNVVYNIVTVQLNGKIKIDSKVNAGVVIDIDIEANLPI